MTKTKLRKQEIMCYLLGKEGPLTREQLTRGAWVMEGMKVPFKPRSNHCYFSPNGLGNGGYYSLVHRGLIRAVRKHNRKFVYDLTPAGEDVAWKTAMALHA